MTPSAEETRHLFLDTRAAFGLRFREAFRQAARQCQTITGSEPLCLGPNIINIYFHNRRILFSYNGKGNEKKLNMQKNSLLFHFLSDAPTPRNRRREPSGLFHEEHRLRCSHSSNPETCFWLDLDDISIACLTNNNLLLPTSKHRPSAERCVHHRPQNNKPLLESYQVRIAFFPYRHQPWP